MSTTIAGDDAAADHPCARTRPVGFVTQGGVRICLRVLRRGRAHHPLPAELDDRAAAPVEGAGAVFRPPLPRRHVRPARQRRSDRPDDLAAYARSRSRERCSRRARRARRRAGGAAFAVRRCGPSLMLAADHPRARDGRGLHRARRAPGSGPWAVPTSRRICLSTRAGGASTGSLAARLPGLLRVVLRRDLSRAALDPPDRKRPRVGERYDRRAPGQDDRRRRRSAGGSARAGAARALSRARAPWRRAITSACTTRAPAGRETGGRLVTFEGSGHVPNGRDPVRSTCCCANSCCRRRRRRRGAVRAAAAARAAGLLADRAGPRPARSGDRARAPPPATRPRDRLARAAAHDGAARGASASACIRRAPSLRGNALTSSRRRASTAYPCSTRSGAWTRSWSRTSCSSTRSRRRAPTTSGSATRRGRSTTSCTRTRSSSARRMPGSPTSSATCRSPEGGEREAFLTADYNAEMIEQLDRYPRVRDLSIFVGESRRHRAGRFGAGLPADPAVGRGPLRVQRPHHRLRAADARRTRCAAQ